MKSSYATPAAARPTPAGWIKLAAWIGGVWVFMFVVAPWMGSFEAARPLLDFVEERDIDAGAYYYTEVDEFGDAEFAIRQALHR